MTLSFPGSRLHRNGVAKSEPVPKDNAGMVMLGGQMTPYVWSINGHVWSSHTPTAVLTGKRVEMTFHDMSMMAHPMHRHGHVFQVVYINGQRVAGAMRDTVHVAPMGMVTVAFHAAEAAPWRLHCHHMAHMATGMMTKHDVRSARRISSLLVLIKVVGRKA